MKLVAYYAVYNEAEYISYSLHSIYSSVDKIIIIEGAQRECYLVNGSYRSNDGTLEIIKNFPDPDNKIQIHYHNENSQLEQRNKIFDYLPNETCWMWLIDGDESYHQDDINKILELVKKDKHSAFRFKSLIFVNDFWHYYETNYFRLFKIEKQKDDKGHKIENYSFFAPNDIKNGNDTLEEYSQNREDIRFFHYSYVKDPKRFMEKKRERTRLHGTFVWNIDENNKVYRPGLQLKDFLDEHPNIMKSHKYYGMGKK